MTQEQKEELTPALKAGEVLVSTQTVKTGVDSLGYPIFETNFVSPPANYQLVRLIEPYKAAVLKDLDYEVQQPTA